MAEVRAGAVGRVGWPVAVPLLCAAHCLAAPLLVLIAPALATSPMVEGLLMAGAFGVTGVLVVRDTRVHGSPKPWVLVAIGSVAWMVDLFDAPLPLPGAVIAAVGGLLFASALVWSGSLRRAALNGCDCPAHRLEDR